MLGVQTARRWRSADRTAIGAGHAVDSEEWLSLPQFDFTALMLFTRKPLYDDEGRLIGVLCISRDITAHHRAEQDLHKRESYTVRCSTTSRSRCG